MESFQGVHGRSPLIGGPLFTETTVLVTAVGFGCLQTQRKCCWGSESPAGVQPEVSRAGESATQPGLQCLSVFLPPILCQPVTWKSLILPLPCESHSSRHLTVLIRIFVFLKISIVFSYLTRCAYMLPCTHCTSYTQIWSLYKHVLVHFTLYATFIVHTLIWTLLLFKNALESLDTDMQMKKWNNFDMAEI